MVVSAAGIINICKKDIRACVAIMTEDGMVNTTQNVTKDHVDKCNDNLRTALSDLAGLIQEAFAAQRIGQHPIQVAVSVASPAPAPQGPLPQQVPPPPALPPHTIQPPPPPPPPPTHGPLAAQTLKYGALQGVLVPPQAPCADAASLPLVLVVSGAGGFAIKTRKRHGKNEAGLLDLPFNCPKPCRYAYMQVEGNHKTRVPEAFILFIKDLHAMCSHNRNSIVAMGLSRGGRWLEEIVREYSDYLDAAIIIAGYPETKDKSQNASVAKELIAVNSTIVCMVHFAADEFCNASKYPV